MIRRLRELLSADKRAKAAEDRASAAEATAFALLDQMRQIEWRLAMCRSCAVDVSIAHSIAFRALDSQGVEPAMSSASRYAIEKNRK